MGIKIDLADLNTLDSTTVTELKNLRTQSAEYLEAMDMNFVSMMSNGDEVILCQGGDRKTVTKDNVEEYVQLVVELRNGECLEQAAAVREGMDKVLKQRMDIVSYLPAKLIDERICGKKDFDVETLKDMSIYTNGRRVNN